MALGTSAKVRRVKHPRYKWIVTYSINAIRQKKYFNRKQDAEEFKEAREKESIEHGTSELTAPERAAVLDFRDRLASCGGSVREALEAFCAQRESTSRSTDVESLVADLIATKEREGQSKRYLQDLRSRLGRFAQDFEGRTIADISAEEISEWLHDLRVSPTTETNYRRLIVRAFNFAQERGFVEDNRAAKAAKVKTAGGEVGILTPTQMTALLLAADESLVPALAIGAFAGLRRAEIERLDWSEIDLDSNFIEVTAAKSKSATRRLVEILPNLRAWLLPHRKLAGKVDPPASRERAKEARERAGINDWPSNALRHSYASYHLAELKDSARLALELGHTNSALIFQHYRELVKPKDAARWWAVMPGQAEDKTVAIA
ncbi:MAG: tyrosine-type recombinase/integrase [Verrucomicrobiales bacterium]|nr:tyrosine-type recombinase/integrase [Verrucomicrobiales bacterium]